MKTAKVTLADATYYLAFDGEAMFTLRDDFGGTQLALEAIEQDTRESFAATCAIAAVLAERGELLRRRLGYDPGAIPEKDDFLLMVRPFEIVTLKRAIMTAIELGYSNIDIVKYLATDSSGKIRRNSWHSIEILPDNMSRIVGAVFAQTFCNSRGGGDY